jgi:hypothetical protein
MPSTHVIRHDAGGGTPQGFLQGPIKIRRIHLTSEPSRDPVTDRVLTPESADLVVIDDQPGQVQAVSIDRERPIPAGEACV